MVKEEFPGLDPARSRLRAAVASVSAAFAKLPPPASDDSNRAALQRDLTARWEALVELLALGPEPELRPCPTCGKYGMRNATLCSHCWARLTPPSHEAPPETPA